MLELDELSYAAIITIELPGMSHPATVTVALRPPDAIGVTPGQVKALRDCSLADLEAFAEALEAEVWSQYQAAQLRDIASNEQAKLKITVLNETGERLTLDRDTILEHAIIKGAGAPLEDVPEATAEPVSSAGAAAEPEPAETTEDTTQETKTDTDVEPAQTGEVSSDTAAAEEAPGDPEAPQAGSTAEIAAESDAQDVEQKSEEEGSIPETAAEPEEAPAQATATAADTEAIATEEVPPAKKPPAKAPPAPPPGRVRIAGLRRPVGHPTRAAADILVNEPAFRDAQAHALSSPNREVAGMLVGPRPEKQPDGRYVVHVTDVILAKHTRMHGASVTYTPESWRYVSDKLNERYPDEEAIIVGWYHTHPGFGIFLSGMDLFIHQNFFTQKWHVALVLDPLAQRSGFFCWDREQSGVHPYEFPWPEWAPHSW